MNGRILAEVALKTGGVYLLVTILTETPTAMLWVRGTEPQPGLRLAMILNLVIGATFGICLIAWGGRIAHRIIPDSPSLNINVDVTGLQIVGFALVGLTTLIAGLKDTAAILLSILAKASRDQVSAFSYVWKDERESVVRAGVEVAAAILLLLDREAIVNLWLTLRGRGPRDAG